MTEGAVVICRRCGFGNVPGDQFCGSCGAFLEWEGAAPSEAAAPAEAGGVATDEVIPAAVVGMVPATPEPASAPTAPAAGSAPAGEGVTADLVRCPVCGTANLATRTFCQSCGGKLAGAARITELPADRIAAAVAAMPAPRTPATPAPAPVTPRTVSRAEAPRSGGIPGWVIAMIVLGVIVGVAVVAASSMLRSEGPATQATDAPHTAPPSGVSAARPIAPDDSLVVRRVTVVLTYAAVRGRDESLCSASMDGERGMCSWGDA